MILRAVLLRLLLELPAARHLHVLACRPCICRGRLDDTEPPRLEYRITVTVWIFAQLVSLRLASEGRKMRERTRRAANEQAHAITAPIYFVSFVNNKLD